jgi:phage terminase large subunit-like protein
VSFRQVWASRGKAIRAEPVSALYEQGRVHHVGAFQQLEDQMCAFTVDFDRKTMGYSPDRLDALVWALTELCVEGEPENRPLFTSVAMGRGRVRIPHWDRVHGWS